MASVTGDRSLTLVFSRMELMVRYFDEFSKRHLMSNCYPSVISYYAREFTCHPASASENLY